MLKRIRKYLPSGHGLQHFKAFGLGVRDGWQQPYDLASSANIEHLAGEDLPRVQNSLDAGANLGQLLRAPRKHQKA